MAAGITYRKGIRTMQPASRSWDRRMRTTNNKAARAVHGGRRRGRRAGVGTPVGHDRATGAYHAACGGHRGVRAVRDRAHRRGHRLLVRRQDQFGCVLDLNVLRQSGGSLIVEIRPGNGASDFRVHWAGARTSDDPGNCGNDTDRRPPGSGNLVVFRRRLWGLARNVPRPSRSVWATDQVSSPSAFRFSKRKRSSPPGVFGSRSITFCQAA